MMNWDDLYSGIKDFANRAATKINQSADIATLQVKLSLAERKLEEAYAVLGKAAYRHFTEDEDRSDRVTACISAVQNIKIEIRALEEQIADAKRRAGMDTADGTQTKTAKSQENRSAPPTEKPVEKSTETALAPVPEEHTDEVAEAAVESPDSARAEAPVTAVSDAEDAVEVTVETVE